MITITQCDNIYITYRCTRLHMGNKVLQRFIAFCDVLPSFFRRPFCKFSGKNSMGIETLDVSIH